MKKVAHICTSAISHKILADKMAVLQKAEYEVHLISSPDGYDEEFMKRYRLKLHFVPMNRKIHVLDDLRSILQMRSLLRRERFDIVHTHTAKAGLIGRVAGWLARTPMILHTSHGLPFFDGQKWVSSFIYRSLERLGALFCDALSSQNREDMEKLRELALGKPVYYEGNGVDLNRLDEFRYRIDQAELDRVRQEALIPEGKKIILMAARLEPVKDHAFLLESLRLLKDKHGDDFCCVLAGKGPLEAEIRRKIMELGLEEDVRLIGHQSYIYPWIKLADIVVLSSEKEGIPRFLMEAMAFSKPAIGSDVLGTRELVKHNETGFLVPYKQPEPFADALHKLLGSDELLKQFGSEARSVIEREFTEQAVVGRLHRMYGEIEQKKTARKRKSVQRIKRVFDFTAALTAVIAFAPLFVLVALLVRLNLGSPVLFRQQRPGLHGKPFHVYKFRTMNDRKDSKGELLPDAERLTTFGKLLRKTSMDELPQLFNVLRGDMSLIGPRPLLMEYLPLYTEEQQKRHWVRPGITGWAQVNGRNAISWEEKFALDVWYTDHPSLMLDAKILWMTVKKVFRADGVQQAGHATTTKFTGNRKVEGF
ncbi:UDP-phosphate galactose phosphotransferase [Paenibacillus elgii]|uniref:UDP-phosphate galactose phosphotransferase n=1 Tax=Paenibacillus elgii TaxID=189691 RepID=A0A2T6FSR3_9BACL|nr:sugar transferase [Paenibacillus elgii]PUA34941.1 UDP-phosphate galactose phosphotransferase [Paenibacillus elgii]